MTMACQDCGMDHAPEDKAEIRWLRAFAGGRRD